MKKIKIREWLISKFEAMADVQKVSALLIRG
jgi:hypothetical protein